MKESEETKAFIVKTTTTTAADPLTDNVFWSVTAVVAAAAADAATCKFSSRIRDNAKWKKSKLVAQKFIIKKPDL